MVHSYSFYMAHTHLIFAIVYFYDVNDMSNPHFYHNIMSMYTSINLIKTFSMFTFAQTSFKPPVFVAVNPKVSFFRYGCGLCCHRGSYDHGAGGGSSGTSNGQCHDGGPMMEVKIAGEKETKSHWKRDVVVE